MPIELRDGAAVLIGELTLDDVEELSTWLQDGVATTVDLSGCRSLHGAILQLLLRTRPALAAGPPDRFTADLVRTLPAADDRAGQRRT